MIGQRIKEHREAMGLTQQELAGRLLVSQGLVAQVEQGMKIPTVAMVKGVAEICGCTTDALIFGNERESA